MMAFEPFMDFVRGIQGKLNNNRFGGLQSQNSQHLAYMRHLQREIEEERVMEVELNRLHAVVFDIETTGFFPEKGDRIISIGAVKIVAGEVKEEDTFYSLVHYEGNISPQIQQLTNISDEQLVDAPFLSDVLVRFFRYVEKSPLIAHHTSHEKTFMQHACRSSFQTQFKHRLFDTSFLYRLVEPKDVSTRLEDLCERSAIPIVDRHHALGDAKLTAHLWIHYMKQVQQLGCKNMRDVYERLARL